jgi:hypothetical protein
MMAPSGQVKVKVEVEVEVEVKNGLDACAQP